MRRAVRKHEFFLADFDTQFRWYEKKAGWEIAGKYLLAVDRALERIAERPDLGRIRHFSRLELKGLRSFQIERPFHRHLIFYRHDETILDAVRIMHGARDLPRRLRQPPSSEEETESES